MMRRPERYQETKALVKANEKSLLIKRPRGSEQPRISAFNGSLTSRKNKKRPITLPERA